MLLMIVRQQLSFEYGHPGLKCSLLAVSENCFPESKLQLQNQVTQQHRCYYIYGRELVLCGSHYTDNDLGDEVLFLPRDLYAENLGCLRSVFNDVQASLWHAHEKNTAHYNLRRKPAEFNVGDIVYKRAFVLSNKDKYFSKKLAPKFIKCRILEKRSPLVYVLEDMSGKNIGVWHIKDLKNIKCS
ncbi:hypothetical protein PYW08_006966 [Mythimna loreyi]|uniref:Uncharacterized protein n=1 Tax=Mythimna loreyi TaxID=667449 RepID=A0ACC2RBT7_9NEOP|nr:hypothetical protein PYW08_006966 [Mythimna loreyi]